MIIILVIDGFVKILNSVSTVEVILSISSSSQKTLVDKLLQSFIVAQLVELLNLFLQVVEVHTSNS